MLAIISTCGSCCDGSDTHIVTNEKPGSSLDVIPTSKYKVVGSYYNVEKYVIEGHEYLIFSSKLANPPTVVHNENCPCHKN
jgi:hypothetical protein